MEQTPQPQAPPKEEQHEVNVEELAAKISSDLLALKEASPEAYQQLVAAITEGEAQSQEAGMSSAMGGPNGVPMSHGR